MLDRERIKQGLGKLTNTVLIRKDFSDSLFIIGHMRSGSTALSNVISSHGNVNGFGEAHITYRSKASLGVLCLSVMKNRGFKWKADYLFDKILHNRYHDEDVEAFYTAKAVFLFREPMKTIASIRNLFQQVASNEYATDEAAAAYYLERLDFMGRCWDRFPAGNRVGLTYAMLMADPDAQIRRISDMTGISPPLENRYESNRKQKGGRGDPLVSQKFDRIMPGIEGASLGGPASGGDHGLALDAAMTDRVRQAFRDLERKITPDP